MKSIGETEMITKAQFGVWTTIISQLFGVNESAFDVTCKTISRINKIDICSF
jgi:hypothetical protein